MSLVHFWIFFQGQVFLSPQIDPEGPIAVLLGKVAEKPDRPPELTGPVLAKSTLCKFDSPVPLRGSEQEFVAACRDAKKDTIWKTSNVEDLANKEKLTARYACLVIETPKDRHNGIIAQLRRVHGALFTALQITVANIHNFSEQDVMVNLKGGCFWRHGEERTDNGITTLESDFAMKRTYSHIGGNLPDMDLPKSRYPAHFNAYCEEEEGASSSRTVTPREFIALFSLFRCHDEDAKRMAELRASSSMKAAQIASHFLLPAFFSCQPPASKLSFSSEMTWKFPLFLGTTTESATWCKYTPRSDFGLCVDDFGLPLFTCEVISNKKESDRWRMLLQATAVARAMHCIKKRNNITPFFVVAIYIRSDLLAERYIIQANESSEEVVIAQKNFHLQRATDSREFLKELYNMQVKLREMAGALDNNKKQALQNIAKVARKLTSYTQRSNTKSEQTRATTDLSTVTEEEPDFTQAADVQEHLHDMGYHVEFVVYGHPNVAVISRVSDWTDRGFLKFTMIESEVQILEHLSKLIDPDNHTIPFVNCWQRDCGGFVIYTKSGGGHLTTLKHPDTHAWSATKQLVAGLAFMHKHNIAHLDIKPSNVHIPASGGRLSINDFSVALRVRTPGKKYRGRVGTEGYMAPEIEARKAYDPIRADLWSCGQTLQELISCCRQMSREREFLAEIVRQLTHDDPLERPVMSVVLAQMVAFESCIVEPPRLRISSPMVAPEACA